VAILPGSFAYTCPVRAVAAWRAAAGIVDRALFRRVDRHGRLLGPMSGQAVAMVIAPAVRGQAFMSLRVRRIMSAGPGVGPGASPPSGCLALSSFPKRCWAA
jgi:hypothetical protein